MNNTIIRFSLFIAIGLIVLVTSSSTIVNENENAILIRLGEPVKTMTEPGWKFHLPYPIDQVKLVDTRLQHGTIRLSETITMDKRNIIAPMFYSWRTVDPLTFLNNVENIQEANAKLNSLITSARNSVIGRNNFSDMIASKSHTDTIEKIESDILSLTMIKARESLGVELVSIGLTEIKLPQSNTEAVFRRMRTERTREASTFRAEGRAEADKIKTQAKTESQKLINDAKKRAEEIRGEAEANAANIYAKAHSQDIEFYRFLRSLQTLRAVVDKNTTIILDTSQSPFDLLELEDPHQSPHLNGVSQPANSPRNTSAVPTLNYLDNSASPKPIR